MRFWSILLLLSIAGRCCCGEQGEDEEQENGNGKIEGEVDSSRLNLQACNHKTVSRTQNSSPFFMHCR